MQRSQMQRRAAEFAASKFLVLFVYVQLLSFRVTVTRGNTFYVLSKLFQSTCLQRMMHGQLQIVSKCTYKCYPEVFLAIDSLIRSSMRFLQCAMEAALHC